MAEAPPARWWRRPELAGLLVVVLALAITPALDPSYRLLLILISLYTTVGTGIVLLLGAAGQLSLGHAIFLATGTLVAGNISNKTGFGLETEVVLAAVLGFAVGAIVGLPSLRVSGLYLAVATLALSFAGQQTLYILPDVTGGGSGMRVGPLRVFGVAADNTVLALAAIVLAGIAFWLTHNLLRGRTGRGFQALRTSETAALSVGLPVPGLKIVAFGLSAALAAVGGVIYMHAITFISPQDFNVDLSILLLLTTIIGGRERLLGALLGAVFVLALPEFFRSIQDYQGILYGTILLVLIMYSPQGLAGIGQRLFERFIGHAHSRPLVVEAHGERLDPLAAQPRSGRGAALDVAHLAVSFGGVAAVRDVSFALEPGEVVGLIGPNGAGKTTAFNAITGLAAANGALALDGSSIVGHSVRRRALNGIGRTFQNLNLHPDRTPLDHVLLGMQRFLRYDIVSEALRLPWVARAEREARMRALGLLQQIGLGSVAHAPTVGLPYGLQKRVDAARALATQPRLLLLDEPAAGLPNAEADELIQTILALTAEAGTTVLIIEHNIDLVTRFCSRIIVMDAGTVIACGTPTDIVNDPRVVEAYLGT